MSPAELRELLGVLHAAGVQRYQSADVTVEFAPGVLVSEIPAPASAGPGRHEKIEPEKIGPPKDALEFLLGGHLPPLDPEGPF